MDSTNGTYLNGGELRGEAPLSDMDEIQIGDTVLRFELTLDEGAGTEPMLRIGEAVQLTDTGRQREANEDSYFSRAPLFAVADGMGGAQAGEVASRMAVEAFDRSPTSGPRRPRSCCGRRPRRPTARSSTSPRATRPAPGWGRR